MRKKKFIYVRAINVNELPSNTPPINCCKVLKNYYKAMRMSRCLCAIRTRKSARANRQRFAILYWEDFSQVTAVRNI
ncbi:MAG: hypothetical protein EOO52_16415 [Gammaproteobacteria bacterium]|nr:MAG: hypothetical protein EOO52_16415 [Gammaproteobacteria bacterium]